MDTIRRIQCSVSKAYCFIALITSISFGASRDFYHASEFHDSTTFDSSVYINHTPEDTVDSLLGFVSGSKKVKSISVNDVTGGTPGIHGSTHRYDSSDQIFNQPGDLDTTSDVIFNKVKSDTIYPHQAGAYDRDELVLSSEYPVSPDDCGMIKLFSGYTLWPRVQLYARNYIAVNAPAFLLCYNADTSSLTGHDSAYLQINYNPLGYTWVQARNPYGNDLYAGLRLIDGSLRGLYIHGDTVQLQAELLRGDTTSAELNHITVGDIGGDSTIVLSRSTGITYSYDGDTVFNIGKDSLYQWKEDSGCARVLMVEDGGSDIYDSIGCTGANGKLSWKPMYHGSTSGLGGNEYRMESCTTGTYYQFDHMGNFEIVDTIDSGKIVVDSVDCSNIFHSGDSVRIQDDFRVAPNGKACAYTGINTLSIGPVSGASQISGYGYLNWLFNVRVGDTLLCGTGGSNYIRSTEYGFELNGTADFTNRNNICQEWSDTIALSDGVATTLFTVTDLVNDDLTGGSFTYKIYVIGDEGDVQGHAGTATFTAYGTGISTNSDIDTVAYPSEVLEAGTLTDTWSIVENPESIEIQLNSNTSLTPVKMYAWIRVHLLDERTVTLP